MHKLHSHVLESKLLRFAAAGGTRPGRPEEREGVVSQRKGDGGAPTSEEAESVSLKERMAMYQAAVSKKEASSSSATVRGYFHKDVKRDGGKDTPRIITRQAAKQAGQADRHYTFKHISMCVV